MSLTYMDREKLKIEELLEGGHIPTNRTNRIGASDLAGPCDRKIWYKWRWVQQNYITPRLVRLFSRGSQEEPIVYAELKAKGIKIHSTQDFLTFAYGYGGGMHDGIISNIPDAPKTPHILEIKTMNLKNFMKLKASRLGCKSAKKEHYVQFQLYMELWKLTRTLYIVTCKDDDQRYYERLRADNTTAAAAMLRAENLVKSLVPPPRYSDTMAGWPCQWCDFKLVCFQGKPVEQNCRTCQHINLLGDGKWGCGLRNDKILVHPISRKKRAKGKLSPQEKGCKKWQINPGL